MANKTVRILRNLPLEGVIYRANDLVTFTEKELERIDQTAYDAGKEAVDYCKGEGAKPVRLGKDPRAKVAKAPAADVEGGNDGEGEISD